MYSINMFYPLPHWKMPLTKMTLQKSQTKCNKQQNKTKKGFQLTSDCTHIKTGHKPTRPKFF